MREILESLTIQSKQGNPVILFDTKTNVFKIDASTYLENKDKFHQSVLNWLQTYLATNRSPISVNLRLPHHPLSSYLPIFQVLELLKECYSNEKVLIMINWLVNFENAEVMSKVKSLKTKLGTLPINLLRTH